MSYQQGTLNDDLITLSDGGVVIDALAGNDTVFGGSGDDLITGNGGYDKLYGGAGHDTIRPDFDDLIIDGGDGFDTLDISALGEGAVVNLLLHRLFRNDGTFSLDKITPVYDIQSVIGTAFNDRIHDDNGDNLLNGAAGDDILISTNGRDTLIGGDGNDTFQSGLWDTNNGSVALADGGIGNDTFLIRTDINAKGGQGIDTASFNTVTAGVSADLSTDRYTSVAIATADRISSQGTIAEIENISGSAHNDTLRGDNGTNLLSGNAGNDRIFGLGGNDVIYGGEGKDTVNGGSGDDKIAGNDGADVLYGGNGADIIAGGTGDDGLRGESGADILDGDSGADRIYGGSGNDIIRGGDGNDLIHGESGNDILTGGSGSDTFVFSTAGGNDVVTDFDVGTDHLVLSGIDKSSLFWGERDGDLVMSYKGGEVVFDNLHLSDVTHIF